MAVSAVKNEPAPAAAEAAPKPPSKKRLLLFVLIGLVVLAAGGGGGWWYFSHKGEASEEPKAEAPKPPVFLPLETFTVNLQLVDNPQFLQTAITLKVADSAIVEDIKLHMPVIRDRILLLMSSRKAADLLTVDGKRKLGDEIAASVNGVLSEAGVKFVAKSGKGKAAAAKDAEDEEDAKDAKDAKDPKDAKDTKDAAAEGEAKEEKPVVAKAPAGPVQAVLFTSFIIQ